MWLWLLLLRWLLLRLRLNQVFLCGGVKRAHHFGRQLGPADLHRPKANPRRAAHLKSMLVRCGASSLFT
jgi:hypothetical protein